MTVRDVLNITGFDEIITVVVDHPFGKVFGEAADLLELLSEQVLNKPVIELARKPDSIYIYAGQIHQEEVL